MNIREYFIILGLDDTATLDEARQAHRDLGFVWHPDRFTDRNPRLKEKAEERLKEINKAFNIVETHIKQGKRHTVYNTSSETKEDKFDGFQNKSTVREGKARRKGRKYSIIASLILVMLGVLGISGFTAYQYMKKYFSVVVNDKVPVQQLKSFGEEFKRITRSLEVQLPPKEKESEIAIGGKKKGEVGNIAEAHRKTDNLVESIKIKINNSEEPLEKAAISFLLQRVDEEMDHADLLISSEKFNESKTSYEMALNIIDTSNYQQNEAIVHRRAYIESILEDPRIVFGSKGYINYGNTWISPEVQENKFVNYKGELIFYKDLQPIINQMTYFKVASFLTPKAKSRLIHKKNINPSGLRLIEKDKESFSCIAFYDYELWTFQKIIEGKLSLAVGYDGQFNRWNTGKISEIF